MNTLTRKQLVDDLMDAYVGWRQACVELEEAYGSWCTARGPAAAEAFERYSAALSEEGRAADAYAWVTRRVGDLVSAEDVATLAIGSSARQTRSP